MQEETLLDLYFSRSETALEQTKQQYGTYCYAIAYRILAQPQDAEECENETYWKAWQVIPPNRPHSLKAFLGKITRNLALHFWERNHAAKRGGNAVDLALDELTECIPASDSVEQAADAAALQACLQSFLQQLPRATRIVFVQRYLFELDCRDCPEKRHGREQSENDAAADKKKTESSTRNGGDFDMRKDREAAKRLLHAIGDIDDQYLLEAEEQPMKQTKKQISNRWMKYVAVAACAGIVLTAALLQYERSKSQSPLTPSATQTDSATTEESVQIPNPFIPCATLQAAADIAGFSLDAPDAYEAYDHTTIQAIEGEMIEVIYEDASETEGLRIRKGIGTDSISGDYNRYDSEETQTIAGVSVSVRKNGDLIFVAEWTDGGYAHSITSENGLTADELETLFSQIH